MGRESVPIGLELSTSAVCAASTPRKRGCGAGASLPDPAAPVHRGRRAPGSPSGRHRSAALRPVEVPQRAGDLGRLDLTAAQPGVRSRSIRPGWTAAMGHRTAADTPTPAWPRHARAPAPPDAMLRLGELVPAGRRTRRPGRGLSERTSTCLPATSTCSPCAGAPASEASAHRPTCRVSPAPSTSGQTSASAASGLKRRNAAGGSSRCSSQAPHPPAAHQRTSRRNRLLRPPHASSAPAPSPKRASSSSSVA